jgi:cell division protein FtsX
LKFVGHVVSVATTQLFHCSMEAAMDSNKLVYRNNWYVVFHLLAPGSEDALLIISIIFIIEVVEQVRKCSLRGCPWP